LSARAFGNLVAELAALAPSSRRLALSRRLASHSRCPVTRYLLGCENFDQGRLATGVRHMMIAQHAESELESAALLVFAGLNLVAGRGSALLPTLLETWEEFRRPEFDRRPKERLLLDAFAEADEPPAASPLARRLLRLPIATLRAQLREGVRGADAQRFAPLLGAGAVPGSA
jgi:hypothetical protein